MDDTQRDRAVGVAAVESVQAEVYRVPTAGPEADGTLQWDATTCVVVRVQAGGVQGLGYTYATGAVAALVRDELAPVVVGRDAVDVPAAWSAMVRHCRNLGRPGLVSMAVAAVDTALWDLSARLAGVPLARLFGQARTQVPVYGSGGFTTFDADTLTRQVQGWLDAGCRAVKIKVAESWGSRVARDLARVQQVRSLVGDRAEVFVDANGGYTRGQARRVGAAYDDLGVTWFEEPVSSDDLPGLAGVRAAVRADVAAGEYADSVSYCERMCAAGAVDCLQIDVTRTAGYTEWLRCAAVAAGHGLQVSGHCAPALHAPVAAAVPNLRHLEWFADHERLERMLFDGVPPVRDGAQHPDPTRPGHGLTLRGDAQRWRAG